MQQTYQDRLHLDATELRWLDACGYLYGRVQRKLYACIAKGEDACALKAQFCADFGLSARHFNAVRMELQGKISSTVEILTLRKKALKQDIDGTIRSLVKVEKESNGLVTSSALAQIKADKLAKKKSAKPGPVSDATTTTAAVAKKAVQKKSKPAPTAKQLDRWRSTVFHKERRLASLQKKFIDIEARLKSPVPGICFGSRKLFKQQFHLDKTEFGTGVQGHANWKTAWRAARSHQFFLVGSKDETAGNANCQAIMHHAPPTTGIAAPATLSLKIKMPPALVKSKDAPAFLTLHHIQFDYGNDRVIAALQNGTALSYRFHRDGTTASGWRVFVSTDTVDAKKHSIPKDLGLLGVDFNEDHLAWARTDRFGNVVEAGRVDLPLHGKSMGQRAAILSDALDVIFAIAQKHAIGVSIENLEFEKKKQELRGMGVKRARKLSGLAYAKYKQLAQGKASRLGVDLYFVDPAYTSVAGSVKYASRQGRTVHQAAAGVIARRAQGYSEKLPQSGAQRAPLMGRTADLILPVRNRCETTRASWASIRKCLTQHCAEQVRLRKNNRKSSPNRGSTTRNDVSKHPLDERTSSPREPGELLARRDIQFPDVPF